MPSRQEFAASIKAKYPQYAAVPDEDLVSKMLEKYPQYKSQIEETPKQTMSVLEMGRRSLVDPRNTPTKEPDTWMGGFTKSISDQLKSAILDNPMVRGAAHPETTGDILGLLLPAGVEGAINAGKGMGTRVWDAVKQSPKARNVPGTLIKNSMRAAETGVPSPVRGRMRYPELDPDVHPHMPNQSGVPDGGVPQEDLSYLMGPEVDHHMPNLSGAPDAGLPPEDLSYLMGPEVDHYLPNTSGVKTPAKLGSSRVGDSYLPENAAPADELIGPAESEFDQFLPNKSGIPDRGVPQDDLIGPAEPVVDRYMPNTGGEPSATRIPNDRIPYGGYQEPSTTEVGRLTGRKSPTLEDALMEGLQEAGAPTDSRITSMAPEADITGGGTTRQSGKFKRSDSVGQAGGYTSGKPGITPTNYDDLIDRFGGRGSDDALTGAPSPLDDASRSPAIEDEVEDVIGAAPDAYRDINDPEWHSGEKASTPEGQEASYLHRRENEMGSDYKRRLNDPLASFLLTGLMGHTAKDLWEN